MERSSRFVSLSGLSGIGVGVVALLAGVLAAAVLAAHGVNPIRLGRVALGDPFFTGDDSFPYFWAQARRYLYLLALGTFGLAAWVAAHYTRRRARQQGRPVWNALTRRLFASIATPLGVGAAFCLALELTGNWQLVMPSALVFYGLALVNGSKFTLGEIYWMGLSFCVGGVLCAFLPRYALVFWWAAFGGLHIAYGAWMYYRYERNTK
jgi:hypothetical protein